MRKKKVPIKLYIQAMGTNVVVGLEGKTENINQWFNFFWNGKATNASLMTLGSENFAYFLTDKKRLNQCLVNAAQLRGDRSLPKEKAALPAWIEKEMARFNFISERFYPEAEAPNNEHFELAENKTENA